MIKSNNRFTAFVGGRSRNVRRRLLRDLILIILLTSGAVVILVMVQGAVTRREISQTYIRKAAALARDEFQRFYEPVETNLAIARRWGEAGILDPRNVSSLNAKLIPVLESLPHVSAMMVADTDGAGYFLARDGDGWLTRSTGLDSRDTRARWQRWDGKGTLLEEWKEEISYDPRERPWFRGALAGEREGEIFWTRPYTFHTAKAPGITGAARWSPKRDGKGECVVAFDLLLDNVTATINRMKPSDGGMTFVFSDAGQEFTRSRADGLREGDGEAGGFITLVEDLEDPVVAGALDGWEKIGRSPDEPVKFTSGGRTFWSGFRPLDPGSRKLWVAVAVPEDDFLGEFQSGWRTAALVSVAILAAGIALAVLLVRKYRHQLRDLPRISIGSGDFESGLRPLLDAGESGTLEFKSTMRMNLKTGKAGKEIELAWLKTVAAFLNTDGGILLIGVDDSGEIVGLDADGFASDDKCRLHFKNLINQHIGLEFSKSLRFKIGSTAGKKVAAVECERSARPVFLRAKGEEAFYIRSGPSSVKLSTSKVLEYLGQRK